MDMKGETMSTQYRIFYLTPGQQAPSGSTGILLSSGGIVWIGEAGTFPEEATLGDKCDTDPEFDTTYTHSLATQEEIDEYFEILNTPPEDPDVH